MTLKQYNIVRLAVVAILAAFVSNSIILHNYVVPLAAVAVASLVLLYLRGRVGEIIADERDYEIAGKAARWAMQVYAWIAISGFFIIYAVLGNDPVWGAVAYALSYSACLLILLYAVIFRFFVGAVKNKRRWIAQALSIAILVAMIASGYAMIKNRYLPYMPQKNNVQSDAQQN